MIYQTCLSNLVVEELEEQREGQAWLVRVILEEEMEVDNGVMHHYRMLIENPTPIEDHRIEMVITNGTEAG